MTIAQRNNTPFTGELFAVEFAALAREIAMDILPIDQILELHRLTDTEWQEIQENPRFKSMLVDMMREWAATTSTRDRVRIKAGTGLESVLEVYIRAINDDKIPLTQRVEAGKFLARLGELDGNKELQGGGGVGGFSISINLGAQPVQVTARPNQIIEGELAE
jgi:hypothetical protein